MLPRHIGIILDGNRRFAKELMKRPWDGHKIGIEKARQVLEWSCESGIKYLTAYVLSLENLQSRPRKELQMILRYFSGEMDNMASDKSHAVHRYKVRVRFVGRTQILPDALLAKMKKVSEITKDYSGHTLNIAIAYGGQQEIVDAVKEILEEGLAGVIKPSDLNEEILKKHLYTNGQPYPDMIIRTGGEKRLSNFLPFQSVYSELIFMDRKWPALTRKDFNDALGEFSARKRKFGK